MTQNETPAQMYDHLRATYLAAGMRLRDATERARRETVAAQDATWRAESPDR